MRKEASRGSRKSRFFIEAAGLYENAKWDRCVKDVKKKGLVDSPYAVCTAQLGAPNAKKKSETDVSKKQLNRAKESATRKVSQKLLEEAASAQGNRFRVILIQEGLGNLKDGYYYTKEALKSAVPVFEGKKFYADHPSRDEEVTRPERSVMDIYGYFENVAYQEAQDGTGQVIGDVVVLPDEDSDHVRTLLIEAVKYSKKFQDQSLVGLSINASGDAESVDAKAFLAEATIVPSARAKIERAISEGLEQVKIVKLIDSAVSCDLVTEAGAKGKVLEILEADKQMAKKAKVKEAEDKKEGEEAKKEGAASDTGDSDGAAAGHDDEDQDKALITQQLKKHGLIKDDGEGDGAGKDQKQEDEAKQSEAEEDEDGDAHIMKAAQHMHQAYKSMGMKADEAAEHAAKAMKASNIANKSMQAEESEAEEAAKCEAKKEAEKKEAKKESAEVLKLRGELAALKEKNSKLECEKHLESKLKESKLPMSVTKKFRESLKAPKSVKEIDEKLELFMEGYRSVSGEAGGIDSFVMTEKDTATETGGIDLKEFVEE